MSDLTSEPISTIIGDWTPPCAHQWAPAEYEYGDYIQTCEGHRFRRKAFEQFWPEIGRVTRVYCVHCLETRELTWEIPTQR